MDLYVCGDLHGGSNHDADKLMYPYFNPSEGSILFQTGDFGFIWNNSRDAKEKYWLDWFDSKPWTTCFIDGNHENMHRLSDFPIIEWNGGKVHKISNKVIHLMRGQIYTINNRKIFTFGGALSIDKEYRVKNVTWWEEEIPNNDEVKAANNNLAKCNYKVDYILTHTCPSDLIYEILPRNSTIYYDPTNKILDKFYETVDYTHWYFGHWHEDIKLDNKHTVLYKNVLKIE